MTTNKNFTDLCDATTWIIKIGSSSLTTSLAGGKLEVNKTIIEAIAKQVSLLISTNNRVILVTSGSVAMGSEITNKQPKNLHQKQACAAVGQGYLMGVYQDIFAKYNLQAAQLLLTQGDWENKSHYYNISNTISGLLDWGVVPIINENDSVATEELSFGDNDMLAALVAQMVNADILVLLTDTCGLFDKNPKKYPDSATLIKKADVYNAELDAVAGGVESKVGRGGMSSKLKAARRAGFSGISTVIASAQEENIITNLKAGKPYGTLLCSDNKILIKPNKQWIANQLHFDGILALNDTAVELLKNNQQVNIKNINGISGVFACGDKILCVDKTNKVVGYCTATFTNIDDLQHSENSFISDLICL